MDRDQAGATGKVIRACAYYRVSTKRQSGDNKNSLPVQREKFIAWCAERDYSPVEEFQDAMSGRRGDRPAYKRMVAAAARGEFDVLVVTHLDRFGRDDREILRRVLQLEEFGVSVEAIQGDIRETIMLAVTAWGAANESKRIGERVKAGAVRAVANGSAVGVTPYGYRRRGGALVPHKPAAAVVREIFRLYVEENLGFAAIASRLNARGISAPRGGQWSSSRISRMVRRTTYAGDFHWGEARGVQPALVPPELFAEAQRRLATRRRLPAGKTQFSSFILTGVVFCGACGGRMNGHVIRRTLAGGVDRVYRGYTCAGRKLGLRCPTWNYHRADETERRVLSQLYAEEPRIPRGSENDPLEAAERDVATIEVALAAVRDRFVEHLRLYHAGAMDEPQLREANAALASERDRLEGALLRSRQAVAEARARQAAKAERPLMLVGLHGYVEAGDYLRVKVILQELVERIVLRAGDPEPLITLR